MLPWASQALPGPHPGQCEMNELLYSLKATLRVGNLSKTTQRSLAMHSTQLEPPTTWTELMFGLRCSAYRQLAISQKRQTQVFDSQSPHLTGMRGWWACGKKLRRGFQEEGVV